MTENNDNTEADQKDQKDQKDQADAGSDLTKARQEAAARRVALRDTEARLEAVQAAYRALAIQHHAGAVLADPSDLAWTDDLAGEDGLPDPAKIADAASALVEEKPHFGRVGGDIQQGYRDEDAGLSLVEALRQG